MVSNSLWISVDNQMFNRINAAFGKIHKFYIMWVQTVHQRKKIPFGLNGSVRVDRLHQNSGKHPCGSFPGAKCQYNATSCISPSDCCFTFSSLPVGLLFSRINLSLWPTVTIHQNEFIGCALASGIQCGGWRCENLSSRAFYIHAKCNTLCYKLYTSLQVTRSMWLWTVHRLLSPSPVLWLVAISGIKFTQRTIFLTLNTCTAPATSASFTCTNCEARSKLPAFPGIVVSTRANQYSTNAPSSFRSSILNSRCSCHRRCPFSAP
jgi:hypothetical protein